MSAPIVELQHVFLSYDRRSVLEDVSLTVKRAEFLGIVGPNGSGKTSLLRVILGLEHPQGGSVRLFGADIKSFRAWHRIGYVPQKAAAFNSSFPATVREVIRTGRVAGRGLWRPLTRVDHQLAEAAIKMVELEGVAERLIGELSGGQQQRVFIARALAGQPELLILDEPTTGVDALAQDHFYSLLKRLRRQLGLTIMLVSHDIGVVTTQVSHLACLNRSLFFHGTPAEFNEEHLAEMYGHPVTLVAHHH